MNYTQLTQEQWYQIAILKKAGHKRNAIADMIGVHKSTISREFAHNTGLRGYRAKQAHRLAMKRRQEKVRPSITDQDWLRIEALLRQEWSPEEIGERLGLEGRRAVSHEWIYRHVYADKKNGGDLHTFLRCQKQRKKRYGSNNRRGKIPNRIGIEQRPVIVDSKGRIGDWEGDTIIGKGHKGAIVPLVERKSIYTYRARSNVSRPISSLIWKYVCYRHSKAGCIPSHQGQRSGICRTPESGQEAQCRHLLCSSILLMGERAERKHQRAGTAVHSQEPTLRYRH